MYINWQDFCNRRRELIARNGCQKSKALKGTCMSFYPSKRGDYPIEWQKAGDAMVDPMGKSPCGTPPLNKTKIKETYCIHIWLNHF